PLLGRKEAHRSVKYFNHAIDFLRRVVEIKAGASCSRHSDTAHQPFITMMSAAHSQSILIGERGQIVWVRSVHDKSNECTALVLRTEDASSWQLHEPLGCITCKLRVVLENCR